MHNEPSIAKWRLKLGNETQKMISRRVMRKKNRVKNKLKKVKKILTKLKLELHEPHDQRNVCSCCLHFTVSTYHFDSWNWFIVLCAHSYCLWLSFIVFAVSRCFRCVSAIWSYLSTMAPCGLCVRVRVWLIEMVLWLVFNLVICTLFFLALIQTYPIKFNETPNTIETLITSKSLCVI